MFGEIHEMRKGLWAFFLTVLFGCWLAEQANSGHVGHVEQLNPDMTGLLISSIFAYQLYAMMTSSTHKKNLYIVVTVR